MDNKTIVLWCDGDWCFLPALERIAVYKNSDDYELIKPDNPLYSEIIKHGGGFLMSGETIVLWPDGDWCFLDDLEGYNWKSDDYEFIKPDNPRYQQILDS